MSLPVTDSIPLQQLLAGDPAAINEELFQRYKLVITTVSPMVTVNLEFDAVSECGAASLSIPIQQDMTLEAFSALLSSSKEYLSTLKNTNFGPFDKKTLVFVLNSLAPDMKFSDSYTIKSISTKQDHNIEEITEVNFDLHPYGSYYTDKLSDEIRYPSKQKLVTIVHAIQKAIIEDDMDINGEIYANEQNVSALLKRCPPIHSKEALLEYANTMHF